MHGATNIKLCIGTAMAGIRDTTKHVAACRCRDVTKKSAGRKQPSVPCDLLQMSTMFIEEQNLQVSIHSNKVTSERTRTQLKCTQ